MSVWKVVLGFTLLLHVARCQKRFCEKSCPANEVFSYNVSQCKNTCYERNLNQTMNCQVGPGCVCRQGYMRNQDTYRCIPINTCSDKRYPKQCADSEFWSDCDAKCQRTCQTQSAQMNCGGCSSGCVCRTGFVRNVVDYQCIPESDCKGCPGGYVYSPKSRSCELNCKTCPANEFYLSCGACEPTCEMPLRTSCNETCTENCFCRQGLVRNLRDGTCILPKSCPRCPENESFKCGNPHCETNCQKPCTKFPQKCKNKCYCDEGYVRALEGGQCVSVNQCPIINT